MKLLVARAWLVCIKSASRHRPRRETPC